MTDYSELLQNALNSKNPRLELLKLEESISEELKKVLAFIAQRFFSFLFFPFLC